MQKSAQLFSANPEKIIQAGSTAHRSIAYELGINSSEIAKNQQTKIQYINNTGIKDMSYLVSVNNLFIGGVMSLGRQADSYVNDLSDNKLTSYPATRDLASIGRSLGSRNRTNYTDYQIRGVSSNIYEPNNASSTASTYSVISGPSNSIVMLNVAVQAGLDHSKAGVRDRKYTEYGKTSQTAQAAFGSAGSDGNTYDYIDTTVYLQANTSGAQISIPVRLIRRAS